MERHLGYLERGGTGRGSYWRLREGLHTRLALPGHPERDHGLNWEAAKTRVLNLLKQRAEPLEPGLSNQELRQITRIGRKDIVTLIAEGPSLDRMGSHSLLRLQIRWGCLS